MADTLVERITGEAEAGQMRVEVQLVMSDRTLLDGDLEPALVQGYGPVPVQWVRGASGVLNAGGQDNAGDPVAGDLDAGGMDTGRKDDPGVQEAAGGQETHDSPRRGPWTSPDGTRLLSAGSNGCIPRLIPANRSRWMHAPGCFHDPWRGLLPRGTRPAGCRGAGR